MKAEKVKANSQNRIEQKFSILRTVIAIVISLAIAFVLIATVSDSPVEDFITLLVGPCRNSSNITSIFTRMIPLLFTGTAICLVNKCGQLNIAAEGAFFAGAVAATVVGVIPGLPSIIHIPICFM